MWVIGHTALAYLVIKLIYTYNKEEFSPRLLIFIFIFANILDSTHIGIFRVFTVT